MSRRFWVTVVLLLAVGIAIKGVLHLNLISNVRKPPKRQASRRLMRWSPRRLIDLEIPDTRPEQIVEAFREFGLLRAGGGFMGGGKSYQEIIRYGRAGNPNPAPLILIWYLQGTVNDNFYLIQIAGQREAAVHMVSIEIAPSNGNANRVGGLQDLLSTWPTKFNQKELFDWIAETMEPGGQTRIGDVQFEIEPSHAGRRLFIEGTKKRIASERGDNSSE